MPAQLEYEYQPIKSERPRASSTTELPQAGTSATGRVTSFARSTARLVVLRAEALHTKAAIEHEARRARLAVERA